MCFLAFFLLDREPLVPKFSTDGKASELAMSNRHTNVRNGIMSVATIDGCDIHWNSVIAS